MFHQLRVLLFGMAVTLVALPAFAGDVKKPAVDGKKQHPVIVQPKDSVPAPGQMPDCIFWPSHPKVVEAMLKLAEVKPDEVVFDLGSGDGRICIAAAKTYGAHAYGYEIQA